jgi:hypothetical protein
MTKIEAFWKNATAEDVARMMAGETVEARFRDSGTDDWQEDSLAGWKLHRSGAWWIDSCGTTWDLCQVYREPSWYANKPDPGPGWRLLLKLPDEDLLPTDEAKWPCDGKWHIHKEGGGKQLEEMWYRRRIEPVQPVESKPLLIRRRVVEIGDEIKLPNGRVWVFNGEDFEVTQ